MILLALYYLTQRKFKDNILSSYILGLIFVVFIIELMMLINNNWLQTSYLNDQILNSIKTIMTVDIIGVTIFIFSDLMNKNEQHAANLLTQHNNLNQHNNNSANNSVNNTANNTVNNIANNTANNTVNTNFDTNNNIKNNSKSDNINNVNNVNNICDPLTSLNCNDDFDLKKANKIANEIVNEILTSEIKNNDNNNNNKDKNKDKNNSDNSDDNDTE